MMHKMATAAALAFALAACDGGTDESAAPDGAEGEVLGGTISDEMLPLDTVRSQSPPLRVDPEGQGDDSGTDDSETPSDGSDDDALQDGAAAAQTDDEPDEPDPPAADEGGASDGQE